MIISGMVRLVRGTPVVRAVASVLAGILALSGVVPLVSYPLLRLDAASYAAAIGNAGKHCAGDPIPARGGCWSAAPARVTVSGVDAQSGASFVVVEVGGQPSLREDFVSPPPPDITVGTTLTARYWHDGIAQLLVAPAVKGADPLVLPTRDNPSYRAAHFPTASLVLLLVGVAGLLFWGHPLLADVRALRNRRRRPGEEQSEAVPTAVANRGLARYGIALNDDVELTGRRDTPPRDQPEPAADSGGPGWSIRTF